jgi:hypothetical protein
MTRLVLALAAATAVLNVADPVPPRAATIEADGDSKAVTVARTEPLTVKLGVQLGLGASWRLASTDGVTVSGTAFEGGGIPGAAELQVFVISFRTAGKKTVVFQLAAPFETEPRATFTIYVNVTG